jgi:hypothetical protein
MPARQSIRMSAGFVRRGTVQFSIVVRPAAEFLRHGALRLFCQTTDLGSERRPAGAAGFGANFGARDQVVQARPGCGSIGLLRTVLAGRDDQDTVLRDSIAGERTQAMPYIFGKRGRLVDIEAQFDGGGDFVDILAARTGGANEGHCEFGIWNDDRQRLIPE